MSIPDLHMMPSQQTIKEHKADLPLSPAVGPAVGAAGKSGRGSGRGGAAPVARSPWICTRILGLSLSFPLFLFRSPPPPPLSFPGSLLPSPFRVPIFIGLFVSSSLNPALPVCFSSSLHIACIHKSKSVSFSVFLPVYQ